MESTYYVTITGLNHYYGKKQFEIGRIIKLIKEPDDEDEEETVSAKEVKTEKRTKKSKNLKQPIGFTA